MINGNKSHVGNIDLSYRFNKVTSSYGFTLFLNFIELFLSPNTRCLIETGFGPNVAFK